MVPWLSTLPGTGVWERCQSPPLLHAPPWQGTTPGGHSIGRGSAPLRMLQEGCVAAARAGVEGGHPQHWGNLLPAEVVPSVPWPCPALTAMRVFHSLALCWQQPMAIHQLRSLEQLPAPPRWDFSRQSSAVVPNSPLSPAKESRAAAVAAPRFQVPLWLPATTAPPGSALPSLQVMLPLSRSWVQPAELQAEHS